MNNSFKYLLLNLTGGCCLVSGAAMANTDAQTSLDDWYSLVQLGGPVVMVLIGMSVVGLAIALYKLLQFRRFSNRIFSTLDRVLSEWRQGDSSKAGKQVKALRSPVGRVLESGMLLLNQTDVEKDRVREELTRQAQWVVLQVHSLLRFIDQIAYLAPLLGLLGTVLGIIDVFRGLADQGLESNPGILAGGIWEALLTTAVGLSVAIPFALIHTALEARADTIRLKMEDLLTRLFTF